MIPFWFWWGFCVLDKSNWYVNSFGSFGLWNRYISINVYVFLLLLKVFYHFWLMSITYFPSSFSLNIPHLWYNEFYWECVWMEGKGVPLKLMIACHELFLCVGITWHHPTVQLKQVWKPLRSLSWPQPMQPPAPASWIVSFTMCRLYMFYL